ncbi:hypothetical protein E2C01_014973 [Portunus trituberculatus]|uniref:Uncharacterized protein n=1 Tax=Portunus trituberculatus TaxID=210409 RepID=A0A5B7DLK7_PORTR|nr:hypothetical protein [Portunus trituberculatus]
MDKVNVFKLRLGTLILLPFELTFEVLVIHIPKIIDEKNSKAIILSHKNLTCKPRYLSTSIICSAFSGSMSGRRFQMGWFKYSSMSLGSRSHMKYNKKTPRDRVTTRDSRWSKFQLLLLQSFNPVIKTHPQRRVHVILLTQHTEVQKKC